ncbi:Lrp/AsnC family transcriptional regulator [Marinilactibacillus sp. XAAS-LB27]|uniref:Lrp/AsnC family transcriptional regulator n=1 Tax=Marinilactibacillus sp. XAAS-LB27 TaxID=3114538 RepID=UPI002E18E804|nr:Lrp/AsnC family transcriptional regulator [Marinilactibacillus sp. XAAS-LB27]
MDIDNIDFKILKLLSKNSRIQWKELGREINMTGQAVGNRVRKLEEAGIIESYTLAINELNLGIFYTGFIIIYLKTSCHKSFIQYINTRSEIVEVNRISGEGCYHLKVKVYSQDTLNHILEEILEHGSYQLYLSVNEIKHANILDLESNIN